MVKTGSAVTYQILNRKACEILQDTEFSLSLGLHGASQDIKDTLKILKLSFSREFWVTETDTVMQNTS